MGGRDDDKPNEFDRMMAQAGRELENTRKELEQVMSELSRNVPSPHDALEDLRKQRNSDDVPRSSPFARFKSFVDSNLALLSDGFKNFPANIKELKERMQEERAARRAEEIDVWRRWTGSDDSPDHIRMQIERASKEDKKEVAAATFMLLRESFERNRNVSPERILDLYRDESWGPATFLWDGPTPTALWSGHKTPEPMLSNGGACYYKPETVENLPSTAQWGWPAIPQQWLSVEWFKRSPYSPVWLEAQPELAGKGEKWRAAFEDLLLASLDKPMQTTEKIGQRMPTGKPQSTYHGPGLDWMLSLQCRGILPPQLPTFYSFYRRELDKDLHMYDPGHTRVMAHLDGIISQQGSCQRPWAEADIQALTNEVGIQAQPETDAFSQPRESRIPQSPWQVPDTEAELYEQMQPQFPYPSGSNPPMTGDKDRDTETIKQALESSIESRDFLSGLDTLRDYERLHGKTDTLLDNLMVCMSPEDIDSVWEGLVNSGVDKERLHRFEQRVDLHERWAEVIERAEALGLDVEGWHASGLSLDDVEAELDEYEDEIDECWRLKDQRQRRYERALVRAEKLGYDFKDWDWDTLPIEELEAELEREETYTAARRRGVLAKAAKLGYDFNGWEHEGLPVQELEDEMLRMEQYAKRDAAPYSHLHHTPGTLGADEPKRPDVLSQLTTTEDRPHARRHRDDESCAEAPVYGWEGGDEGDRSHQQRAARGAGCCGEGES